jgi:FkbM family methyltransferase
MLGRKDVGLSGQTYGLYLGQGRALARTKWGTKMWLDASDALIAPYILLDGEWEPGETALFRSLFKPGMVFVDAGANIGYYSMLAAKLNAEMVYSFEPNPSCFSLLRQNAILNWVKHRVCCEQMALLDREGTVRLHVRRCFPGNSSIGGVSPEHLEAHGDEAEWIEVPAMRLDTYIEQRRIGRVDLVKVDVEGAEPLVFEGMRKLMADNPGMKVLCEWSPEQMEVAGQCKEKLASLWNQMGYRIQWVENRMQAVSCENLPSLPYANLLLTHA